MKKLLISFATIMVFLVAALIIIPIVFKDDIKGIIDQSLTQTVNADIVFDIEDLNLSLLKNFPHATVGVNNLALINRAPFAGQRLLFAKEIEVEIDLISLFSEKIVINKVKLDALNSAISILKDGKANYDIGISNKQRPAIEPSIDVPAKFDIEIKHWQIINANIVYNDASKDIVLEVKNLSHQGSGDFNQEQFHINTRSNIEELWFSQQGVEYLSKKHLSADVDMHISQSNKRFNFKNNKLMINDFALGFNGFLSVKKDGSLDMDLSFASQQNTFKSLLSLVPGIYSERFKGIESTGKFDFSARAQGIYNAQNLPAFNLALKVDQAMFKYPELPNSVSNINLDLSIHNQDGIIKNTVVDLKQFHMDLGSSPVDAKIRIANLDNYDLDGHVKGNIDLAEVASLLPMQGLSSTGNINLDLNAKGIYDSPSGQTPKFDAKIELSDGQVKKSGVPFALDNLNFKAEIRNPTGKMDDFVAIMHQASMEVDKQTFTADFEIANLNNYRWKLNATGGLDLGKISQFVVLDDIKLKGNVKANISTAGNIEDLKSKKYQLLPTTGNISLKDFEYSSGSLDQNITLSSVAAAFDPKAISIRQLNGQIGESDFAIVGSLSNYMGYLFAENQPLQGVMQLNAKTINLNEFIPQEQADDDTSSDKVAYGVVQIPKNMDFLVTSKVQTVHLMDISLTNVVGEIKAKDGIAKLNDLKFKLLDGRFVVNGSYDSRELTKPRYNLTIGIDELSASKTFESIKLVQTYFPIANNIEGMIGYKINMNGSLKPSMAPDVESINAAGSLTINQAKLKNSKALIGLGSLLGNQLLSKEQIGIKDMLMTFNIQNGLVTIKPFEFNLAGYQSSLSGTSSLVGGLDLALKLQVPAGKLGRELNALVFKHIGEHELAETSFIPLNIGISGSMDSPSFKLNKIENIQQILIEQAKGKLSEKLVAEKAQQRQNIIAQAQAQADKLLAEAKKVADNIRAQAKAQADKLDAQANDNPLKKILIQEASKKLKKEADEAADKVEIKASQQADLLLSQAKKEAEALD